MTKIPVVRNDYSKLRRVIAFPSRSLQLSDKKITVIISLDSLHLQRTCWLTKRPLDLSMLCESACSPRSCLPSWP